MAPYQQILPEEKILSSEKILFIIHLAIGDYTYMQNMFRAFHEKYPHIKIDLFILENRCTTDESKWPFLEKYVIYDWLETCGFYHKVYKRNYAPQFLEESILEAQTEKYPIVITLGTLQNEKTEVLGRRIAGKNGLLVGLRCPINWYRFKYQLIKQSSWKELDISFYSKPLKKGDHISEVYNSWCEQLVGETLSYEERLPFVDIPSKWKDKAHNLLLQEKIKSGNENSPTVFINYLAKDPKRSWKVEQAFELISELQSYKQYKDITFVLSTIPEQKNYLEEILNKTDLKSCFIFSATDNFYELPAMLQEANLIISVETSIIHLANAVKTPVVALMRQRTPEWDPLDRSITTTIWCKHKKDNIENISPKEVAQIIIQKNLL